MYSEDDSLLVYSAV